MVKDKPIHLKSAVRYPLGNDSDAKSTDRLRRVSRPSVSLFSGYSLCSGYVDRVLLFVLIVGLLQSSLYVLLSLLWWTR
jgi:hypothetical protein